MELKMLSWTPPQNIEEETAGQFSSFTILMHPLPRPSIFSLPDRSKSANATLLSTLMCRMSQTVEPFLMYTIFTTKVS